MGTNGTSLHLNSPQKPSRFMNLDLHKLKSLGKV